MVAPDRRRLSTVRRPGMVAGLLKADLHLHSRFSERAPEWLFRRAGLPDSYSQPADLYDQLRAAGHDFVTLTDHNSIDGCLTIADRAGVFISEQIATQFPEDRCAVELLVWGLDERQHRDTIGLRENVYELQAYLAQQGLAHAVAHPLHVLDGRLTLAHFEKLILLFSHFEGLNGLRDQLLSEVTRFVLDGLTPAKIDELAHRHGLAPTHPEPWRKILTGGSDDHGGMFPGSAFTTTPATANAAEFLEHVRAGRCEPGGKGGTPLIFSHGMYNNLRQFIASRFSE